MLKFETGACYIIDSNSYSYKWFSPYFYNRIRFKNKLILSFSLLILNHIWERDNWILLLNPNALSNILHTRYFIKFMIDLKSLSVGWLIQHRKYFSNQSLLSKKAGREKNEGKNVQQCPRVEHNLLFFFHRLKTL